ncbi:hypothetical protein XPR_1914, partial [Xanthomonas arboricola pv. pruni MAFF 301420]
RRRRSGNLDPRQRRQGRCVDQSGRRAGHHPGHAQASLYRPGSGACRTAVRRPRSARTQYPRPAGSGHRRAHAAGGCGVPPLPAPGPRPLQPPRQAGAPAHHRRRHRAGQGPDRKDCRSVGASGAQLDRPRSGNARCAPRLRQGRDRHDYLGGLASGRPYRDRSQRRRPWPQSRQDPGKSGRTRHRRAGQPDRCAGVGSDLRTGLLHRRCSDRPVRPWRGHGRGPPQHPGPGWRSAAGKQRRQRYPRADPPAADPGHPRRHDRVGGRRNPDPAAGLRARSTAAGTGRHPLDGRRRPGTAGPRRIPADPVAHRLLRLRRAAVLAGTAGGGGRRRWPEDRAGSGRTARPATGGGQEHREQLPPHPGRVRRHHPGRWTGLADRGHRWTGALAARAAGRL